MSSLVEPTPTYCVSHPDVTYSVADQQHSMNIAQPQGEWVDLTDDEIKTAYESWWETNGNHAFPIWVGAKSVIAKFKEKNTPPVVPQDVIKLEREIIKLKAVIVEQADKLRERDVPQGEPVAWVTAKESFCGFPKLVFSETQKDGYKPLYAAPVRTKDLTDDEIKAIVREASRGSAINRDGSTSHRIARAVIAADREKNK